MKPGVPWSVKGIEPEAREAAKEAARKAGMTLGQWLNHAILDQDGPEEMASTKMPEKPKTKSAPAARSSKAKAPKTTSSKTAGSRSTASKTATAKTTTSKAAPRKARPTKAQTAKGQGSAATPAADAGLEDRLGSLTERLDAIAASTSAQERNDATPDTPTRSIAAARSVPEEPAKQPSATSATEEKSQIAGLAGRLGRTEAAIEGLRSDFDRVATRLDDSGTKSSVSALENTLVSVVDHIEITDKRNSDVLKTIQSRLSDLTDRIGAGAEDRWNEQRDAMHRLEDRLGELAERIDSAEPAGSRDEAAIGRRLDLLTERVEEAQRTARENPAIEEFESQLQQIASKLSLTEKLMAPQSEVNTLRTEIGQLKSEASKRGEPTRPALVQAIESRLNTVTDDIESLRSRSAPRETVAELTHKLDGMGQRLADTERELSDRVRNTALEERLADMARRIDDSLSGSGTPHPDIVELERKMEDLTARVVVSGAAGAPAPDLSEFDDRINRISDRLDRAEQHFSALHGIESNLSELFKSLDSSRDAAIQAAEQAAHSAAQKMMGSDAAAGAGAVATGDALSALERGLAEIKSQAAATDAHNQETMESVQDTLKKVVDRLGSLEQQETAIAAQPGATGSDDADLELGDFRLPPLPDLGISEMTAATDAPTQAAAADDAPVTASHAEDGSTEGTDDAFARAYDGASASGDSPAGGSVTRNEDFIAAARRAARAASGGEAISGDVSGDPAPDTGEGPPRGGLLKGRRRSLLFAAAAVFIIAGALSVSGLVGGTRVGLQPDLSTMDGAAGDSGDTAVTPEEPVEAAPREMSLILDEPSKPVGGPATAIPATVLQAPVEETAPKSAVPAISTGQATDAPRLPAFAPVTPSIVGQPGDHLPRQTVLAPRGPGSAPAAATAAAPKAAAPAVEDDPAPQTVASLGSTAPDAATASSVPSSLEQAAAQGDTHALFAMASRHAEGSNGEADFAKAAQYFQQAAAKGLAVAQYRLGALYEKGNGVAQDKGAAQIWYQRAAEQGNAKAMHNLAVLLAGGGAGRPDYTRAARWFTKAADLGLADSQFNLGVLYERGLGVPRDLAAAYTWFAIASAKGDAEAEKRMAALAGTMKAEDLARARAEYQSWQQKPLDPAANTVDVSAWTGEKTSSAVETDQRARIARAQLLLSELGYDPGPPDGLMGPRTRDALAAFARERGLSAEAGVSSELILHLEAANAG